jgi:urea carboxylase
MFRKVLIANRGAIACRIVRTLDRMGIASVAVYSEADRHAMHVMRAGEAVAIGPSPAAESYLKADAILDAACKTGAEAIHPGYGFLSENPGFAEACGEAGIVFIGPQPLHMRAFGLKHRARELALQSEVPVAPGSILLRDIRHAMSEAARIGYPLMIKSTAGGGGIGLQLVNDARDLAPMYERVEAPRPQQLQERRHLHRNISARAASSADLRRRQGTVVSLGERDCSAQRRNQKIVERRRRRSA